jgi:hypothetical protein
MFFKTDKSFINLTVKKTTPKNERMVFKPYWEHNEKSYENLLRINQKLIKNSVSRINSDKK